MSELIVLNADFKRNYTKISNEIIETPSLTGLAKSILAYILGRPPGWEINLNDLGNRFKDSMHQIKKAINELRELGYLTIEVKRGYLNRITGKVWKVLGSIAKQGVINAEPCSAYRNVVTQTSGRQPHNKTRLTKTDLNKTLSSSLSKSLSSEQEHSAPPIPQVNEREDFEILDLEKLKTQAFAKAPPRPKPKPQDPPPKVKPVTSLEDILARCARNKELAKSEKHQERLKEQAKIENETQEAMQYDRLRKEREEIEKYGEYISLSPQDALEQLCAGKYESAQDKQTQNALLAIVRDKGQEYIRALVDCFSIAEAKQAQHMGYVKSVCNSQFGKLGAI